MKRSQQLYALAYGHRISALTQRLHPARGNSRRLKMSDELDPRAAGARRLRDKVCIVTGAGQGIGRAAAKRLGQEGGKIVVADRGEPAAQQTLGELRQHRVDASSPIVDLR